MRNWALQCNVISEIGLGNKNLNKVRPFCQLGFSSKITMLQLGSSRDPFSSAWLSLGNLSLNSTLRYIHNTYNEKIIQDKNDRNMNLHIWGRPNMGEIKLSDITIHWKLLPSWRSSIEFVASFKNCFEAMLKNGWSEVRTRFKSIRAWTHPFEFIWLMDHP